VNTLNNLKIGVKLTSAFLLMAAIAGVIGGVGIVNLRTLNAADTRLYENMAVPLSEGRILSPAVQAALDDLHWKPSSCDYRSSCAEDFSLAIPSDPPPPKVAGQNSKGFGMD
jgi:hypothetical protein